jgi:predicted dehydrogenase
MPAVESIIAGIKNRITLRANHGPLGIGLIGIGGWGATNAANIMRSRRFTILGVHDVRGDSANLFTRRFRVKCHAQVHDLLAEPAIRAVCITIPNHLHADLVRAAADSGKHIFVEKPLASSPAVCRALGAYCREKQVVLQVGHQMRRDPVFREIKHILNGLGEPLYVQGVYTLDRRTRDDWRCDGNTCPGGSMEQLGVHLLDSLIYLFGRPLASHGWTRNIPMHSNRPDWGGVVLTFPRELKATICTSFSLPSQMRLEIFLADGYLTTDGKAIRIAYRDGIVKTCKPRGTKGGISQFVEFADCIERCRQPETGAEEAAVVMEAVQSMFSDAAIETQ